MTNDNIEPKATTDAKTTFCDLLKSTKRAGVEKVLDGLDKLGFFTAPASSRHHLASKGGLVAHSLNVLTQAKAIREAELMLKPELADRLTDESIVIAALLHDVCKAEIYKPCVKNRKNAQGQWESYQSYDYDYSHCPLGHGEKSVIRLLRMGLELTDDEILAIRWHMANWDMPDSMEARSSFSAACAKCPLLSVIIAADELATRITEM